MSDHTEIQQTSPHVCPHTIAFFLDNWFRTLLQNPKRIVGSYIKAGDTVVDLGCGPGFFTVAMARMAGEQGRVIAVDLQEKMIAHVKRKAARKGVLDRMAFHQCAADRIGLEIAADFILAYYMVHETPDPKAFLEEATSLLKENGRMLVVEPRFHVDKAMFHAMLEDAEAVGLKVADLPKGKGGRSGLFGRSACHLSL